MTAPNVASKDVLEANSASLSKLIAYDTATVAGGVAIMITMTAKAVWSIGKI